MSPEEALIRAVETDPTSDLPRLVYADWLDENGREPFADFLRTELELAKLPLDSPDAPPLRERLWQAWAAVDAVWLHRFTQPNMLRANPTPFPAGWWHIGLGIDRPAERHFGGWNYRSLRPPTPLDIVNTTEQRFGGWDYHSLPQLTVNEFLGSFAYLDEPSPPDRHPSAFLSSPRQPQLARLWERSEEAKFPLPRSYLKFMQDSRRLAPHRSVANCSFVLPDHTMPIRRVVGGNETFIPCYADNFGWLAMLGREATLCWEVCSHRSGGHCVVARFSDAFQAESPSTSSRLWFVAPSFEAFEAFVYRIWLENRVHNLYHAELFQRLGLNLPPFFEVPPVTPAIQAYIDHYRRGEPGA